MMALAFVLCNMDKVFATRASYDTYTLTDSMQSQCLPFSDLTLATMQPF